MQTQEKQAERPEIGQFFGFHHVVFWVGNAKQAAGWYATRFGFEYLAYSGLETNSRQIVSHVLKNNNIIFVFQSPLEPGEKEINTHIAKHGDGVRDVCFAVDDCKKMHAIAVSRGAKSILPPTEYTDEHGTVIKATLQTYGDTVHSLIQLNDYKGVFLPGFEKHSKIEKTNQYLPPVNLIKVDHVVGNQPEKEMQPTAEWYLKMLDFHRFWSVDDSIMHTEFSALNSFVVSDWDETIKMPINEPAKGLKKSQIQEYVEYYGGPGVQHIALLTDDIIKTIHALTERGVDFLSVPGSYYTNLRKAIPHLNFELKEDLDLLEKYRILMDYDDKGYLLQIFTKPVEDRPTLFFEIIQRRNNKGFGAGNFKSLFQSIQDEQALRGNLVQKEFQ